MNAPHNSAPVTPAALAPWAVDVLLTVCRVPHQRVARLLWCRAMTAQLAEALAFAVGPVELAPMTRGKVDRRKVGRVRRRVARYGWRRLPPDLLMVSARPGWARTLERCVAGWPDIPADSWVWASTLGLPRAHEPQRRRLDGPRAPQLLERLARVWQRETERVPRDLAALASRLAIVLRDVVDGVELVDLDVDGEVKLTVTPEAAATLVPGGSFHAGLDAHPIAPAVWFVAGGLAVLAPPAEVLAGEAGPVAAVALRAAMAWGPGKRSP